ncbi:hypothetical protein LP420_12460 [Massilia sp. B-10]|nr:hypothetical protein LP420_12460 [Massilia sp. B-10]UUZ56026.1 hypothetical protein LP419_11895 [Massilia sp. H-1]
MVQTRLALAAVEIEEESQRLLGYFVLALLSLILFGIAMVLVALTIILVFWDSYRLRSSRCAGGGVCGGRYLGHVPPQGQHRHQAAPAGGHGGRTEQGSEFHPDCGARR